MRTIELANKLSAKLGLESLIVAHEEEAHWKDLKLSMKKALLGQFLMSELPITSAVGHEIDYTMPILLQILGLPTPSAAAEVLSTDQDDYYEYLHNIIASLNNQLKIGSILLNNG